MTINFGLQLKSVLTNLHASVSETSADRFVWLVVAVTSAARAAGAAATAVLAAEEVLEPLEEFRVPVQERPGQLDQFVSADDLLVEQDQATEEVLVDFGAAKCHSHLGYNMVHHMRI